MKRKFIRSINPSTGSGRTGRKSREAERTRVRHGYIMIFTLLVVGAAMVVVAYVMNRATLYVPFAHMIILREKAKMLALGGVEVAIAQLTMSSSKEKAPQKNEKSESKEQGTEEKDLLRRIWPALNRWQLFTLTENNDGIDGQLHVCIMCEEGKINLNRIIDFDKGVLKSDKEGNWKAFMQEFFTLIEKNSKTTDLFKAFERIIKDRAVEFNDATELITHKEFSYFKDFLFYQPPAEGKEKKEQSVYLTDIFTVWSSSDKIEPWLFSESINNVLGCTKIEADDVKKRKEQLESVLKNFKQKTNWQQDWNTLLMPLYGKELRSLPKNIDSLLSNTFAPCYFSILVHAKVGDITQRLYVIVERNQSSSDNEVRYDVTMKKLYWL